MLRPADGVDDRRDSLHVAVFADRRKQIDSLQVLFLGDAGNTLDGFWRVTRILLLHQLEDAARMLQRQIIRDVWRQSRRRNRSGGLAWYRFWRVARAGGWRRSRCGGRMCRIRGGVRFAAEVSALLIIPGGLIVSARPCVKPGVQAIFGKFETFLDDERGVRIVDQILFRDAVVLDSVANQPAEECNVTAGANLHK